MATFNQVTFIGRLGKDPEIQVTSQGTPYTRFSIAVDQGKDTDPMWLNIVCWNELAERGEQLLFQGAQTFVQGRLQIRKYQDKKTKTERVAVDVVASTIQLLEKKRKAEDEGIPEEVLPGA